MYLSYCFILYSSSKKPHNRAKNNLQEKQVNEYYCNIVSEMNVVKKKEKGNSRRPRVENLKVKRKDAKMQ